jgi:sarcosine oxidase
MVTCGGIDAGPEDSAVVAASQDLSRAHGLPCDILTGTAFNRRHPLFNLPPSWRVAFQPKSGFVRPDATRVFLHAWAKSNGARLLHNTRVEGIDPGPNRVAVRTTNETIEGDILIASAGGWMPKLFPDLALPLSPERRVIAWFDAGASADGSVPIFCLDGEGGWYGMPTPDGMIKLGHDKHLNQRIDPDNPTLEPDAADAARLAPCIQRYFNGISSEPTAMKACIYTLTPDKHFVVDRHPAHDNIVLFSCCSGHGFKYAPAYGGIAEDFISGVARPDLAVMALKRSGQRTVRYSE